MHHLVEAFIEPTFSAHYVGNKYNEEPILLSETAQTADDDLLQALKEYFLKPFKSTEKDPIHQSGLMPRHSRI